MQADAAKENRDMTMRTYLVAATALTLGVVACNRNADNGNKASETNTTSASQPVEQPAIPSPSSLDTSGAPADQNPSADLFAKDGGQVEATPLDTNAAKNGGYAPGEKGGNARGAWAKDGGHINGPTGVSTGTMRNSGEGDQVAPGHITTPAGRGRGTGQPNSNGSHDMGSGAGTR
jgi:hypothetical protein